MAIKLTPKQEAFCRAYVETGNASEAYRSSYDASKMKPQVIHVKAAELLASGKISVRVDEIRAEVAKRNEVTVDSLMDELEEARQMARDLANPAAMVSATMGKAKITGHDKKILQHQNPDGTPFTPVSAVAVVDKEAVKSALRELENEY